jgi:hypothetical protein
MRRLAEFMKPSPGELVAVAVGPYMRRVPRPGRESRPEAASRVDSHPYSRRESVE